MPDERSRLEELLDAVRMDMADAKSTVRALDSKVEGVASDLRDMRTKTERQAVLEARLVQLERDLAKVNARLWQVVGAVLLAVIGAVMSVVLR